MKYCWVDNGEKPPPGPRLSTNTQRDNWASGRHWDFMHSIKSSLKNVYILGKVWSTRDMAKNKRVPVILYSEMLRVSTEECHHQLCQNSHPGVKVEEGDIGKPRYGDCNSPGKRWEGPELGQWPWAGEWMSGHEIDSQTCAPFRLRFVFRPPQWLQLSPLDWAGMGLTRTAICWLSFGSWRNADMTGPQVLGLRVYAQPPSVRFR